MKTGKPRWSVGCVQNGPMHDAGLRWFVCERALGGDLRAVAYTHEREQTEMIVASLERGSRLRTAGWTACGGRTKKD